MISWPLQLLLALAVSLLSLGGVEPPVASPASRPTGVTRITLASDGLPLEKRLQQGVRDSVRSVQRALRRSVHMQTYGPRWFWRWTRRAAPPLGFALLILLAEPWLLLTWKRDGLASFATFASLTVYVYVRLLLSSEVRLAVRLSVLAALIYGVWRSDLIPDRYLTQLVPGRLDDFLVIAIAVRLFVYACPEEAVARYADRAMTRWRRLAAARSRTGDGTTAESAG